MEYGVIINIVISLIISIMSFYLVKKLEYNPLQFKEQRLKFFFGMFWLSVGLIYLLVTLIEIFSLLEKFFSAQILFITTVSLAVVPVIGLSCFLSVAIFGRSKKTFIFPIIMLFGSISYILFVLTEGINGPIASEFGIKWFLAGPNSIMLTQLLGYTSFAMCLLIFFIAFRTKQKLIVFKIMAMASSISFFFLAGYLDLLGAQGIEIIIIRAIIALGAITGYYAFYPTKFMIKLVKMISSFD